MRSRVASISFAALRSAIAVQRLYGVNFFLLFLLLLLLGFELFRGLALSFCVFRVEFLQVEVESVFVERNLKFVLMENLFVGFGVVSIFVERDIVAATSHAQGKILTLLIGF
jgi:hypothetical protein